MVEKSKKLRFKNSIIFNKLYDESQKQTINYDEIELLNETIDNYQKIIKKIINYNEENFLAIEKNQNILKNY